jgi:hypothetical protein
MFENHVGSTVHVLGDLVNLHARHLCEKSQGVGENPLPKDYVKSDERGSDRVFRQGYIVLLEAPFVLGNMRLVRFTGG